MTESIFSILTPFVVNCVVRLRLGRHNVADYNTHIVLSVESNNSKTPNRGLNHNCDQLTIYFIYLCCSTSGSLYRPDPRLLKFLVCYSQ